MDLETLQRHPGAAGLGGEVGWAGPLAPEACRRLACDGAVTRVLITRTPTQHGQHDRSGAPAGSESPAGGRGPGPMEGEDLAARLQAAQPCCPRSWVGPPASRWTWAGRPGYHPAQRTALAVRDGGCLFADCQRPLAWCEGHHVWHRLDGGPTDPANLVLLCRAHHRAVDEAAGS